MTLWAGASSPRRGVRRRVLADAAWGPIRRTDTTHTLCQDHSCGGTRPPTEGTMGRHRGGRQREPLLHADAARLLAEADYPPSVKQTILLALRGGRPGKQTLSGVRQGRAALPVLAAASLVTGRPRPAGAPRGLLALCDASWPARRRRDRGLARTPWPGRHGGTLSEDVSQTCARRDSAADTAQHERRSSLTWPWRAGSVRGAGHALPPPASASG